MRQKLIAFVIVLVTRHMYNSKIYHSEWDIWFHTVNEMIISGWMIYILAD